MKTEKSQVTIFIVLGIVLLICIGTLFYIASVKMKAVVRPEHGKEVELISERDSISDHVTSCLRKSVIDGYYEYGFHDEGTMESYVNLALKPCMEFSMFEKPGSRITATDYYANVDVTDRAVFANITMSITVRKGDSLVEFSGFNYYLSYSTEILIKMEAERVKDEIHLTSSDSRLDCIVPAGTQISGLGDKKISIQMKHSDDTRVYGYIIYDVKPDGVTFDGGIECTLLYDDRYWPNREEEIKVGLLMDDGIEELRITGIDTEKNIITFTVSHFTAAAEEAPKCNKKGIFTLLQDTDSMTYYCNNIEWALEMAGTSGWVTQIAYTDNPVDSIKYFVDRAIYRELWPVLRLETSYDGKCWRTPGVNKGTDENGNTVYIPDEADVNKMVDYVNGIPNLRYMFVLNEQNLAGAYDCTGLTPEEYAAYYLAVAEKLHSGAGDKKIYVMNAPVAHVEECSPASEDENEKVVFCTKDWIRRMFNSNTTDKLKEQIDLWASNSYPGSRDNGEKTPEEDSGIKWYETELNLINQQYGFLKLNETKCWHRCRGTSAPDSELNTECLKPYFSDCKATYSTCISQCTDDACKNDCKNQADECEKEAWDNQCTDEKLWEACVPPDFCGNGEVFKKNVLITETGYNINKVGEEKSADYMAKAYEIWGNDGKVIGATPFILWDPTGVSGWTDFEWVERLLDYSIRYKEPFNAVKEYNASPVCENLSWKPIEEEFDLGEQQDECPLMPTGPGDIPLGNISPGDFHGSFDYCNYCDVQNKFGIHTFFESYNNDGISAQMEKIHELTGDCGWFKQYIPDVLNPGMMDKYVHMMKVAKEKKLIPVLRLEQHGASIGDYETYASKMVGFVKQLQSASGVPVYFVEVLNEPNLETQLWADQQKVPQMYAEFFITVAKKFNNDPQLQHIIVLNGGLAPGIPGTGMFGGKYIHTAEDFISGMFDNGEVGKYITVWASHVYFRSGGDETYKSELNVLEEKMGKRPKVMITEGGCMKDCSDVSGCSGQAGAASMMADAFNKWLSDPDVVAVMPYALVSSGDWTEYNWIEGSGTLYANNAQFNAVKKLREITEMPTCSGLEQVPEGEVRFSEDTIQIGERSFKRLILQNNLIMVSVLPELGGRVYEMYYKPTGNNQLYKNPVYRTVPGRIVNNNCEAGDRGWIAPGGIEIGFPTAEHGCVFDQPFTSELKENGNSKSIVLSKSADGNTRDLELIQTVTLEPNTKYITLNTKIYNPTSESKKFQYWIAAQTSPGGTEPTESSIEFLIDTDKMISHGGSDPNLPPAGVEFDWRNQNGVDYRYYKNWKGYGGMFSSKSVSSSAVLNTERGEGIKRSSYSYPAGIVGGTKIWGSKGLKDYTSSNGPTFVELFGGLSRTFDEDVTINSGQTIEWSEQWSII